MKTDKENNDKPKPRIQPPEPKPGRPQQTDLPPSPVKEPPNEPRIIPEIDPNMPAEDPSRDPGTPPPNGGCAFTFL